MTTGQTLDVDLDFATTATTTTVTTTASTMAYMGAHHEIHNTVGVGRLGEQEGGGVDDVASLVQQTVGVFAKAATSVAHGGGGGGGGPIMGGVLPPPPPSTIAAAAGGVPAAVFVPPTTAQHAPPTTAQHAPPRRSLEFGDAQGVSGQGVQHTQAQQQPPAVQAGPPAVAGVFVPPLVQHEQQQHAVLEQQQEQLHHDPQQQQPPHQHVDHQVVDQHHVVDQHVDHDMSIKEHQQENTTQEHLHATINALQAEKSQLLTALQQAGVVASIAGEAVALHASSNTHPPALDAGEHDIKNDGNDGDGAADGTGAGVLLVQLAQLTKAATQHLLQQEEPTSSTVDETVNGVDNDLNGWGFDEGLTVEDQEDDGQQQRGIGQQDVWQQLLHSQHHEVVSLATMIRGWMTERKGLLGQVQEVQRRAEEEVWGGWVGVGHVCCCSAVFVFQSTYIMHAYVCVYCCCFQSMYMYVASMQPTPTHIHNNPHTHKSHTCK